LPRDLGRINIGAWHALETEKRSARNGAHDPNADGCAHCWRDRRGKGNLETWRRAKAVLSYLRGGRVIEIAEQLGVTRGSVNRWLQWFDAQGTGGLKPRKAPGPQPRMSVEQLNELATIIEAGPQSAGYATGVWTGPMIGDLIRRRYVLRAELTS
jgi:transposase